MSEEKIDGSVHNDGSTKKEHKTKKNLKERYAGFWVRYAAYTIDTMLIAIGALPLIIGFAYWSGSRETKMDDVASDVLRTQVQFIIIIFAWIYHIFLLNKYEATIGKKVMGIKVAASDGRKMTLKQIIIREVAGKVFSVVTLLSGFFMVGLTKKKQGLHDKVADTKVLYVNPLKNNTKKIIIVSSASLLIPTILVLLNALLISYAISKSHGI